MTFTESKTGQFALRQHQRVKDKGRELWILLFDVCRANKKKTGLAIALLLAGLATVLVNLSDFVSFFKTLTGLMEGGK